MLSLYFTCSVHTLCSTLPKGDSPLPSRYGDLPFFKTTPMYLACQLLGADSVSNTDSPRWCLPPPPPFFFGVEVEELQDAPCNLSRCERTNQLWTSASLTLIELQTICTHFRIPENNTQNNSQNNSQNNAQNNAVVLQQYCLSNALAFQRCCFSALAF